MATTNGLLLPIPELTDTADGPDGFSDLANAVEDYVFDRILPSGVTRAPAHHWGSISSLPTGTAAQALRPGDTAFHSVYKVLIGWDGTNWRQIEIPTVASNDTTQGLYDGQYRDVQGLGLSRWSASATAWQSVGPTAWTSLPLIGTVANTFGYTPAYRYTNLGRTVELRGVVQWSATPSAWPTLFVAAAGLPTAARPAQVSYFLAKANGAVVANGQINADGSIQVNDATARTITYLVLDGAHYDLA